MITAANLTRLSNLDAKVLKGLLQSQEKITGSKFLGLTNGGEFCYHVVYHVKGGTDSAKVFVRLNPTNDMVSATMA
jgi:hypothetical protein